MTLARRRCVLLLPAFVIFAPARLQAQKPDDCRAALTERGVPAARQGADPCHTLAVMVSSLAPPVMRAAEVILRDDAVPVGAIFSQRDLQARHPQQAATGGSPAQGHAIPSVQPAGVAAGTIAAVGTDAGSEAIAALGLNPAILFLGEEISRRLAQYSRFADLSILLPVSQLTEADTADADDADDLRYLGVRLRINVHGLAAGDQVWNTAHALVKRWIERSGRNEEMVRAALVAAPDLRGCVNALFDDVAASITASCGAPVSFEVNMQEAEELREEFANVRRAADAKYFGADVRLDFGDPTMGAVANAKGTFMFAGLSYGRRLTGSDAASWGLRARLGARHAKLEHLSDSELAVEGGFGLELTRRLQDQEINASGAVEFRYGDAAANLTDQFQSNFIMARGSFLLPITPGNSLSINVGAPISGDVSPILSINFNWGLLLPNQRFNQ